MSATTEQRMVEKTVRLAFAKSTPGTRVYATSEKGVVCNTVYLTKTEVPEPPPASIELVVRFPEK